jgi:hypothetical protein
MTHRLRAASPRSSSSLSATAAIKGALISLLSAGIVDRLMLKPLTTSLAQTVIRSAVQQHRTLARRHHSRDADRATGTGGRAGRSATPCRPVI